MDFTEEEKAEVLGWRERWRELERRVAALEAVNAAQQTTIDALVLAKDGLTKTVGEHAEQLAKIGYAVSEPTQSGQCTEPYNDGGSNFVVASPQHYVAGIQIGKEKNGVRWLRVFERPFRA